MNFIQTTAIKLNNQSDNWGAIASTLCLAHCLLTPFLFIAHAHAHAEDHHDAGPMWWGMIDYLFLIISFIAVSHSAKKTTLKWMPFALYTSWALLAAYLVSEKYHLLHLAHEWVFLPALSLVFLHLYNRRHCACEDEECCVPETEM